jgi:glycosyltransferase involved in cell wall biosynthesis
MLSIMLATWNRPAFLRVSLESVRRQTALAAITRIVVSENSTNDESRQVCAEFPDLPIVYVQQNPPVPSLLHLREIWHLGNTPLVAILHDDDWWAPEHIAKALKVLESSQETVAVYSNFFEAFGPEGVPCAAEAVWLVWLASGCNFSKDVLYFDPRSVMIASLLNAGFHYSTVVGRNEAMHDACLRNIARGNTFDNDRTFPVHLSSHGLVAYLPQPDTYIRQHPFRHAWAPEHLYKHFEIASETTRYLLSTYPDTVSAAAQMFNETLSGLNPREADAVWRVLGNRVHEPQRTTLIRECGIDLGTTAPTIKSWRAKLKRTLRQFCPPILWAYGGRMRGGWQAEVRRWQKEQSARTKKAA